MLEWIDLPLVILKLGWDYPASDTTFTKNVVVVARIALY